MPSVGNATDKSSLSYPFHTGVFAKCHSGKRELVSYALGIEFTVNNIPEGVYSYEIVRCDRNETNRTIVTQGIAGGLFKFDTWGDEDKNIGDNDIRPAPMFSLTSNFVTDIDINGYSELRDTHTTVPGYLEFVSPEICIMKDTILSNLQNSTLCLRYNVDSMCNARVSIPQTEIYVVGKDLLQQNDPRFGTPGLRNNAYHINMGYGKDNNDWNGYAGVFKYYNISEHNQDTVTIEDAIVSNVLPYRINLDDAKSYAQFIGNKTYVNMSIGGIH